MKTFFRFITEAAESQASAQARKLNLSSDGHGGWLDSRGKFVAKTENGKLKFVNKKQPAKDQSPAAMMSRRRRDDDLAGAPRQKQDTKPRVKKQDAETEKKKGDAGTLTVAFGRFNPPTVGHEKLLNAAQKAAVGGELKIYPSRTQDPKKNPLDPDMKVSYMRKLFPKFEDQIINDPDMRSIFDVLKAANEEGYKNINIIVGADRQAEFENLATKYNGELYDFDEIRTISAGVRDADAAGVEGMSASKLRKAVVDNDYDSFRRGVPKSLNDADTKALYDAVRSGMKIKATSKTNEDFALWKIAPKYDQGTLRENYVTQKLFKLGDLVENLNTGLVGKIIRRGTNYLICVTEEENMFKSWIRDVMEARKIKPAAETGIYGVPAEKRGFGSDSYREYAQSMVPGQQNIRNFINKYRKKKTS